MAPVVGSGRCPAWMARVPNLWWESELMWLGSLPQRRRAPWVETASAAGPRRSVGRVPHWDAGVYNRPEEGNMLTPCR